MLIIAKHGSDCMLLASTWISQKILGFLFSFENWKREENSNNKMEISHFRTAD